MKTYQHIIFSVLILIILLPTLFFPISNDLAVFYLAGKTILHNGKIYVDFIDIKTPLIYLINSFNQIIFGNSEFSFRLFDFLWQVATSASIIFVLRKFNKDFSSAYLASVLYVLLYSTLHYSQTYQCEGFLGLPLIWLTYLQVKTNRKAFHNLLQGFILGFIISLKITFGIVLIALLIIDLLNKAPLSQIFKKYCLIIIGLIISLIAFCFPLIDSRSFEGFLTMLDYLRHYNEYTYTTSNWLNYSFLLLVKYLSDSLSIILLFAFIVGVYFSLTKKEDKLKEEYHFFQTSIIIIIFLFLSVIIEQKFHNYHFSRFYTLLAIISAFGFVKIYKKIKSFWKDIELLNKFIIIAIIILSFVFSPLTRYLNLYIPTSLYFIDKEKYNSYYQRNDATLLRNDFIKVATKIKEFSDPQDLTLVISIGSNAIYYFSESKLFSGFASSSFYLSKYLPTSWLNKINSEFDRAKWMVIQTNDIHPLITGHWLSSWDVLNSNIFFKDLIKTNFIFIEDIGPFKLFKRKS